jgi:hypothetical protein
MQGHAQLPAQAPEVGCNEANSRYSAQIGGKRAQIQRFCDNYRSEVEAFDAWLSPGASFARMTDPYAAWSLSDRLELLAFEAEMARVDLSVSLLRSGESVDVHDSQEHDECEACFERQPVHEAGYHSRVDSDAHTSSLFGAQRSQAALLLLLQVFRIPARVPLFEEAHTSSLFGVNRIRGETGDLDLATESSKVCISIV